MDVSGKKKTGRSDRSVPRVPAPDTGATVIPSGANTKLFRIEAIWFYLLLSAIVCFLLFLRRPGAFLFPTLYFEDGIVFYRDQLLSASAATVFKPPVVMALRATTAFPLGYYILVPRIVSFLAWLAPAAWAPYIFNLAGLTVGATATSFFCLPQFRCIVASDGLRVAVCLLFAISLDSTEALASPSNCFWLLGIPVMLLAVIPPALPVGAKWWQQTANVLGGVLLGLATPLVVAAAPVALWQTCVYRNKNRWQLPAGLFLGALWQIVIYFEIAVRPTPDSLPFHAGITALLVATAHRVVMSSILGWNTAFRFMSMRLTWVPLLGLAFLEGITLYLAFRGNKWVRLKSSLCLYVLVSGVILALVGKGFVPQFQRIDGGVLYGGSRYFFLSSCAFAVLTAMAIEQFLSDVGGCLRVQWLNRNAEGAMILCLTLMFGYGAYQNFHVENGTDPHWQTYAAMIESWKAAVAIDSPAVKTSVPINAPGWSIDLPANRLVNGDVESGMMSPWTPFGGARAAVSTLQHRSGAHSLSINGPSGIVTELLCSHPGKRYRVTAWAKSDCSGPQRASIWLHDGAKYQVSAINAVSCSDWGPISVEFTSTDTHTIWIHLVNSSGTGILYWDDIAFSPL